MAKGMKRRFFLSESLRQTALMFVAVSGALAIHGGVVGGLALTGPGDTPPIVESSFEIVDLSAYGAPDPAPEPEPVPEPIVEAEPVKEPPPPEPMAAVRAWGAR